MRRKATKVRSEKRAIKETENLAIIFVVCAAAAEVLAAYTDLVVGGVDWIGVESV